MKYISILRGINVNGQKKIIMKDLKSQYENVGFTNVETYIQSGNVIFNSTIKNSSSIKEKIENLIENKYKFHVLVIVKTNSELSQIIKNCPFGSVDLEENGTKILLTFFSSSPSKSNIKALPKYVVTPDELIVNTNVAYLHCPNGYGKSKLSNNFLEKKLGVDATSRNWKTVVKLHELSTG